MPELASGGAVAACDALREALLKPLAGEELSRDEAVALLATPELTAALLATASALRDRAWGRTVTFSPKVFLPVTNLCRDRCTYCTFRKDPDDPDAWTMTPDEIAAWSARGRTLGCKEALMCLGDKPEVAFPAYRATLAGLGHRTTAEYVYQACAIALDGGLLPHTNAGLLSRDEMARLKEVNVSLGLMLENVSPRLRARGQVHQWAPDKEPALRLRMLREAGELRIPFTTGLLLGIGETLAERVDTLLAIRELHRAYGHVQEVIVQNFRAKPTIPRADASVPAPPNLSPADHALLLAAGLNDWGGISPLTPDYVNPEAPWPHVAALAATCRAAGYTVAEGEALLGAEGDDLVALVRSADTIRAADVGDEVTYVVNRNINFTNVCFVNCQFCAFKRQRWESDAYTHALDIVLGKVEEAIARGATEVCMQGGINPDMQPFTYRDMLVAIKSRFPEIHVHAFSPMEIMYGARRTNLDYPAYIGMLRDRGLGSIPGTAAEILDDEVREILSHKKVDVRSWVEIITTAHRLGVPTTATVMYGHVETAGHIARHIDLLRRIQKETGGFTEFVPLGFIWENTKLYRDGRVTPQPKGLRDLRIYAASRLMLRGLIDNLQTSWVKLGHRLSQLTLLAGCNDFGGTLMEESISREAGADAGEYTSAEEIEALVRAMGRIPVERTTLYGRAGQPHAGHGAGGWRGRGPVPLGPHPAH